MFDDLKYELICDTCGNLHNECLSVDNMQKTEGHPCKRPWCTGHYKFVSLEEFGYDLNNKGSNRNEVIIRAIRETFFDLPTFDRNAYKEECILREKEKAEAQQKAAQSSPINACPKCGQVSFVTEISTKRRVGSVFALGLASPTIGKSYRCTACKHTW